MLGLLDINSKHAVVWSTLGVLGVIGMVAVVSPPQFAKLAAWGGRWIDSNKILQVFDKRIADHAEEGVAKPECLVPQRRSRVMAGK